MKLYPLNRTVLYCDLSMYDIPNDNSDNKTDILLLSFYDILQSIVFPSINNLNLDIFSGELIKSDVTLKG